jgi:2-deoxy-D-gluconate 3-dehydrogenase
MKDLDLSGKVAVVIAGNRGIGLDIARSLAGAGAMVVIANRGKAEGQKAAETLKEEGCQAVAVPVDVCDVFSIKAMVNQVISDLGGIDILVNNAGITKRNPAEDVPEEEWDYVMNINLKGLFFCSQTVGREMIRRGGGKSSIYPPSARRRSLLTGRSMRSPKWGFLF